MNKQLNLSWARLVALALVLSLGLTAPELAQAQKKKAPKKEVVSEPYQQEEAQEYLRKFYLEYNALLENVETNNLFFRRKHLTPDFLTRLHKAEEETEVDLLIRSEGVVEELPETLQISPIDGREQWFLVKFHDIKGDKAIPVKVVRKKGGYLIADAELKIE